jgi:DNA-binding transcriptional MocR family regulator
MNAPPQTVQINVPAGFIDLGLGDPPLSLLPLDLIRRAAEGRLSQDDNRFLQYGAEQGDGYFRLALADFLAKGYGFPVNADHLFVTTGISSALDLLCTLFTRPGDTVFVEEPSYFLALRIFADHGLRVVSVQTDEAGLVIGALEEALEAHRPKFLYTIPTFQNPSGHTLTQERRERLVALSKKQGFLVLADEVYHFLHYTAQPPKSFGAYVETESIISLGSFSKILAPGLRLGWMQAHPKIIQRLAGCGLLDSGGGLNPFTSAIVRSLIEDAGLEQNIAKLVEIYGGRVKVMEAALRRYLPMAEFTVPHGGYFFWVRLPKGSDAAELQRRAEAFKVGFRPGIRFSSQGGLRDYIRLSHVYYDAAQIEEGLRRLRGCLDASS